MMECSPPPPPPPTLAEKAAQDAQHLVLGGNLEQMEKTLADHANGIIRTTALRFNYGPVTGARKTSLEKKAALQTQAYVNLERAIVHARRLASAATKTRLAADGALSKRLLGHVVESAALHTELLRCIHTCIYKAALWNSYFAALLSYFN